VCVGPVRNASARGTHKGVLVRAGGGVAASGQAEWRCAAGKGGDRPERIGRDGDEDDAVELAAKLQVDNR
jgi:hypothetical protein